MKKIIISIVVIYIIAVALLAGVAMKTKNPFEKNEDAIVEIVTSEEETSTIVWEETFEQPTHGKVYELLTSYQNFTIISENKSAVIKDAQVVEGDLEIRYCGPEIAQNGFFIYEIPELNEGESYSITPSGEDAYETLIVYYEPDISFTAKLKFEEEGVISISQPYIVSVEFAKEATADFDLSEMQKEAPWYSVDVHGVDEKITVDMRSDKTIVKTKNPKKVDVLLSDDLNELALEQIETDSNGIEITGNANRDCIVQKGDEVIFSKNYGYCVLIEGYDTILEKRYNVEAGSLLEKMDEPSNDTYEFQGWYKDWKFENKWDFDNDRVTENTILYAKWE